jgi:hypothetical protein
MLESLQQDVFVLLKYSISKQIPIQQLSLHKQLYKIKVKRTSGCLKNDNRYEKER